MPFPKDAFFDGIRLASLQTGEIGFFLLANRFSESELFDVNAHHYVLFTDFKRYPVKFHVLDYVMYSTTGKWAFIANTLDIYGLLTCKALFLEHVKQSHFDLEGEAVDFIDYWLREKRVHSSVKIDWIFPVLADLYGREEAARLMLYARKNFRVEKPRSTKIHVINLVSKESEGKKQL